MPKLIVAILLSISFLLSASAGYCNEIGQTKTEKNLIKQEVVDENKTQPINKNLNETAIKSVGGIKPVSPEDFAERLEYLVTTVHEKSKPIAAIAGKFGLTIIGLIMIVGFVISKTIMRWAFLAIIAVALGLLIFFNADTLNGLLIWASSILNGGKK